MGKEDKAVLSHSEGEESDSENEFLEENEHILGEDEPTKKRELINNQELMKIRLEELKKEIDWIERMDVTVDLSDLPGLNPTEETEDETKKTNGTKEEVVDDFQRELQFYRQAQVSAKEALSKLRDMGVPTERPEDYFAEMVKSDAHMQKIRQKMLSKKEAIEKSEKAKKQRTLKKYGKQIQHQVLQKRQQDKKKMLQAVDHLKKNKGKLEKLSGKDDMFDINTGDRNQNKQSGGLKRKRKDDKFGFGGQKKKFKKNSAQSSANAMSDFKRNVHGKKAGSGKPGGKSRGSKPPQKRLGKSRRNKNKSKN